jgi:hypothetical protein
MSDFKAVSHYATLAGFRVMVIANRFACDNRIARLAHDNLIHHLDMRIAETRRFIALENVYNTATDEWVVDNADYEIYKLQLRDQQDKHYSIPLLAESHIEFDRETREWRFRGASVWHLHEERPIPEVVEDEVLCGLSEIIEEIRAETGLVFTTYALKDGHIDNPAINPAWNA